jgi:hypothetical protein
MSAICSGSFAMLRSFTMTALPPSLISKSAAARSSIGAPALSVTVTKIVRDAVVEAVP